MCRVVVYHINFLDNKMSLKIRQLINEFQQYILSTRVYQLNLTHKLSASFQTSNLPKKTSCTLEVTKENFLLQLLREFKVEVINLYNMFDSLNFYTDHTTWGNYVYRIQKQQLEERVIYKYCQNFAVKAMETKRGVLSSNGAVFDFYVRENHACAMH